MAFTKSAVLAAVVSLAAGVSAVDVSKECTSTLTSLVASPDANCLNPGGLLAVFEASQKSANTSLITPINAWLNELCKRPVCTDAALSSVIKTVATGCKTDLTPLVGEGGDAATLVTPYVQQFYPRVRKVACTADTTDNNKLCVTQALEDIEPFIGSISFSTLLSLTANTQRFEDLQIPKDQIPKLVCTDCNKALFNAFATEASQGKEELSQTCGASFVDGTTPASLTQLDKDTKEPNGAVGMNAGLLLSGLAAIGSAFAFLA